jgi:hypothetical protein
MWLEGVLGICLGCQVYRVLVARRLRDPDPGVEICSDGSCRLDPGPAGPGRR